MSLENIFCFVDPYIHAAPFLQLFMYKFVPVRRTIDVANGNGLLELCSILEIQRYVKAWALDD